jgi:hypothetical protein
MLAAMKKHRPPTTMGWDRRDPDQRRTTTAAKTRNHCIFARLRSTSWAGCSATNAARRNRIRESGTCPAEVRYPTSASNSATRADSTAITDEAAASGPTEAMPLRIRGTRCP